jgi:hypothetical protein
MVFVQMSPGSHPSVSYCQDTMDGCIGLTPQFQASKLDHYILGNDSQITFQMEDAQIPICGQTSQNILRLNYILLRVSISPQVNRRNCSRLETQALFSGIFIYCPLIVLKLTFMTRHFNWMAQHGVDGAFLQRFANQCDLESGNEGLRNQRDEVRDR